MSDPIRWRKSSHSGSHGGDCVEVADLPSGAAVRDSQHPDAGHLTFAATEWQAFLTGALSDQL
ncbi:DUF397 domain-containing protein [Nocardiopsis halophila]|uniref:DUF397 domain-containing protein n=1 Tax=Nocardiopsis halophila TaxID=141692 RepID=UPI000374B04D|nr:DUF397 domain-containing protein [Nocardiopsis halophila]